MGTASRGCGCGGRRHAVREERAAAPAVVQPLGEDHRTPDAEPQEEPGAGAAPAGVVPGRKAGNLLGLRDASAPAPSRGGGCGCGGHGGHGRCGCGSH
ncbi:hypothetical protein H6X68_10935 [Actinomyces sp. 186855]|nr:hypothetical protein [Actinomyces sp. AC-20-1]MCL3790798.1 hypothetical protein [Actinomyces sp. 187325]MCL3793084.1 hypothetical protein [Actinomyces sp. 186855]MCL3795488.1 hypothetical protein [Actinomyces sp. 217892]